jgi:hypothetical protein
LGGYLQVNLRFNSNERNRSLVNVGLSPIENTNFAMDLNWRNSTFHSSYISYSSEKILSGTYVFFYQIRIQTGFGSDDFTLGSAQSEIIQIFPGETRILEVN